MAHHDHGPDEGGHDHAHPPFDPEPVQTIPDDEAPTPTWLPLLGLGLLALASLAWLTMDEGASADPGVAGSARPNAASRRPAAIKPAALKKAPTKRPPRKPAAKKAAGPNPRQEPDIRKRILDPTISPVRNRR